MALFCYKEPIMMSTNSLKNLVVAYNIYTPQKTYSTINDETCTECEKRIALLQSGIKLLQQGKEDLQKLYDAIMDEYKNCKSKSDKKDLQTEIEQIVEETKLHVIMAQANDLVFILRGRLDENICDKGIIQAKLGQVSQKSQVMNTVADEIETLSIENQESEQNGIQNDAGTSTPRTTDPNSYSSEQNYTEQSHWRSIKPPQATLPEFSGDPEDFAEYWAVFETLVHKSREVGIPEKIMLLKQSLRGRAQLAIKGIKLIPENYNWIIKTLQEKYCDQPTNRSQIVQKLLNLRPANNTADSCSSVFDEIQVLVNQMLSTEYDVSITNDPMWYETIIAKFPQGIVKSVLISGQTLDKQTIGDLLAQLKKEIAAKCFVETRLGHTINNKVSTSKDKHVNQRPHAADKCIFCHRNNHASMSCRTVNDQNTRRKILRDENRCWKCYSPAHTSYDCNKSDCPLCGQKHHSTLCFKRETNPQKPQNQANWNHNRRNPAQNNSRPAFQNNRGQRFLSDNAEANRVAYNNTHMGAKTSQPSDLKAGTNKQLVLMTAEGDIWNVRRQQFEKVLFFFDSGAQKTVIEEKLIDHFGLPKQTTEICTMSGIGGHTETFKSHVIPLRVGTAFGEELEITVQTKPVITNGFPSVKLDLTDIAFLKANNICLANPCIRGEHQIPHILVGLDYYHDLVIDPKHGERTPSGFYIANTVFGPTIYGRELTTNLSITESVNYSMTAVCEKSEQELLQNIFELEGLGITSQECQKDEVTQKYFEDYSRKISFENGIVTAPFPLKENVIDLEDNYTVAIRRLQSLQHTLMSNPEQSKWYCHLIDMYKNAGIIETFKTPNSQAAGIYYMPHSGVWKAHKKVPLRVVFDASSKRKGKLCLNDVIQKGESFVNKIHDILTYSRFKKFILTCDIEAAFTQIRLPKAHKDLCRFLWLKNVDHPPTKDNIVEYRFNRLPFGVTASPSILNMAILAFLNLQNSALAKEIAQNLYVDNILLLSDTEDEAVSKYHETKSLFAQIGMNLREYVSNSKEVNSKIAKQDLLTPGPLKLLGVNYNTIDDSFKVETSFSSLTKLTKRDIVSQINSVFDPIGLAGPLLVRLKTMMREVFDTGVDWKTPLPHAICNRWSDLCSEVNQAVVSINRYMPENHNTGGAKCLWVFADASKVAMAACAYLHHKPSGYISPLISGKTRLTPKKCFQTIPRLELLGILMAARLSKTISDASKNGINEICLVSDSEIALCWIKSHKKLPIFVANQRDRILKIKEQLEATNKSVKFYHVATNFNPADAGSRGLTASEIANHDWVLGPQWLKSDASQWPLKLMDDLSCEEIAEQDNPIVVSNVETITVEIHEKLIELKRFSKLNKALRVMATVGKFAQKWVALTNKNRNRNIELIASIKLFDSAPEITANDVDLAEKLIIAQEHKTVIVADLKKRFHEKQVVLDKDGIIRHHSRLQNAMIPSDTKSPIYVPEDSELTRLLLEKIHVDNGHCGKDHTLCIARQRFWIPRPSRAFQKLVKNCVICKKYQGPPFGAPMMPSLPKDRVVTTKPFQNVGCDFMGPFTSKSNEKMYICLYTCLTTRAVHLEVVENLTAGAFLNSFLRFVSRRGAPTIVRSDCGTNFKLGELIIQKMFERHNQSSSVMSYCASERIQWLFNPPASPWMGGAWERLVGIVKKAFNKSIGRKRLTFADMCTAVARIEAIINTRPLTKLSSSDIAAIPLRPVDFLRGNLSFSIPTVEIVDDFNDPDYDPLLIQTEKQANEALQSSEAIANKFWEKWNTEYLTSLREMQRLHLKQPRSILRSNPQVGEIVLIEQELIPRGCWSYGKIVDTVKSADGLIRSATILLPNKKIIQRPVNKIFPLEIRSSTELTLQTDVPQNQQPPQNVEKIVRNLPERASKTRARNAIRELERSTNQSMHIPRIPYSLLLLAIMSLASPIMALNSSAGISCYAGKVHIAPQGAPFTLCIDNDCKKIDNFTSGVRYAVPISPINVTAVVRKVTSEGAQESIMTCERPLFCDHQKILSKTLLGNPHCWPLGAIATVAIILYVITMLAIVVIGSIWKLNKKMRNRAIVRTLVENPTSEVYLPTFAPAPLPGLNVVTICILASSLILSAHACQKGYTRHTANLVCTDTDSCHYEYSNELLFNKIISEICIEIMHGNMTIGTVKLTKRPTQFTCSKVLQTFTRDTKIRIFHVERCAQAGSCIQDKCHTMHANETVDELRKSKKYPGYSGCIDICGGIPCGCFLPLPACQFYRVAHRPISDQVFEVISCIEWKPTVHIRIEYTKMGKKSMSTRLIQPYVTEKINNFDVTVVSIQKLSLPLLNRRFALSGRESFVLPDKFQIPVECSSELQAKRNFSSCTTSMRCHCDNSVHRCLCPDDSINALRNRSSTMLPLETPVSVITRSGDDVIALSDESEFTMSVASSILAESAEEIFLAECEVRLSKLTGCYSCLHGATLVGYCHSSFERTVTILCETQYFNIQCSSNNESTSVNLALERAVINEKCTAQCHHGPVSFALQGTLNYHISADPLPFEEDSHAVPLHHQWFSDITVPDITPLVEIIRNHWHLAIAALTSAAILAIATYLGGPIVLVYVVKVVFCVIKVMIRTIIWTLRLVSAPIAYCLPKLAKSNKHERIPTVSAVKTPLPERYSAYQPYDFGHNQLIGSCSTSFRLDPFKTPNRQTIRLQSPSSSTSCTSTTATIVTVYSYYYQPLFVINPMVHHQRLPYNSLNATTNYNKQIITILLVDTVVNT